MSYQITITDAGRQALVNAENTGSAPLVISELAFGTGAYEPDGSETALQAETKRVNTLAGSAVGDGIIHLTVRDESNDSYSVNEFGLFTDTGVLFAVYAQIGDPIIIKSVSSALLLAIDMAFVDVDAASITFGDTNFSNPPATGTTPGIVRFQQHLMETSPFVAMRPGAFGLGGHMPIADANLAVLAGFYSCVAGTPNTPIADRAGVLIVAQGGEDADGVHQTWCLSHGADQGLRYERHFSTSDGWSEWMETGGSNTITLDGPALIYPGTSNEYLITNYDSFSTYTAAISAGATATLVDEVLTIDVALDTEPTDLTLTLSRNDKERAFAIEVGPVGIVTPAIESPIDGATDVIETSTVYSSPYATYPPDFDTHASSDWQIATDAAFTDVVFESLGDADNLTSLTIPAGVLDYLGTYHIRVRYHGHGQIHASAWSLSEYSIIVRKAPYPTAETAVLSGIAPYDFAGRTVSLSVDGVHSVLGTNVASSINGYVLYFSRDEQGWQQKQVITAPDATPPSSDWDANIFGFHSDMDDAASKLAVVASNHTNAMINSEKESALYVFTRTISDFVFEQKITSADTGSGRKPGGRVVVSPDGTVIALKDEDDEVVLVFSGMPLTLAAELSPVSGGLSGTGLGIDQSGNTIIAGNRYSNVAYWWEKDSNGNWVDRQIISPSLPIGSGGDGFGFSIVLSNNANLAFIMSYTHLFIFERQGDTFVEIQYLNAAPCVMSKDPYDPIAITPDGQELVYRATNDSGGTINLAIRQPDGSYSVSIPGIIPTYPIRKRFGGAVAITPDGKRGIYSDANLSYIGSYSGVAYDFG